MVVSGVSQSYCSPQYPAIIGLRLSARPQMRMVLIKSTLALYVKPLQQTKNMFVLNGCSKKQTNCVLNQLPEQNVRQSKNIHSLCRVSGLAVIPTGKL